MDPVVTLVGLQAPVLSAAQSSWNRSSSSRHGAAVARGGVVARLPVITGVFLIMGFRW